MFTYLCRIYKEFGFRPFLSISSHHSVDFLWPLLLPHSVFALPLPPCCPPAPPCCYLSLQREQYKLPESCPPLFRESNVLDESWQTRQGVEATVLTAITGIGADSYGAHESSLFLSLHFSWQRVCVCFCVSGGDAGWVGTTAQLGQEWQFNKDWAENGGICCGFFGGHVVRLRLIQTYEAKHLIFTWLLSQFVEV